MNPLPHDTLSASAFSAVKRLQEKEFTAYLAGGCVRDLQLGLMPKDYDVATDATPEQILELFPGSVAVGKSFGVIRATCDGEHLDIATFRQDQLYLDGRRPEVVTFVTSEEDANRRDFTINAIFYDPISDRLHDYVGGLADLEKGVIRCVGAPGKRFKEDYLRMLRAVRFASTLGFVLAPSTADAIRKHASLVSGISAERIQGELTRTLLEARRSGDALALMNGVGLLEVILPEVAAMRGQEQPPEFHPEGDVFTHTVLMLNMMTQRSLHLAYAALLHDVGKPVTSKHDGNRIRFNCHAERGAELARKILLRLRLPKRDIDAIVHSVRNHMRFLDVRHMRQATLRRLVGAETFEVELELHRLDCMASHGKLDNYDFLLAFKEKVNAEPVLPPPLITGLDIIEMGVREGPEIGKLLRLAYDAQLDGKYSDRDQLLKWIRREMQ